MRNIMEKLNLEEDIPMEARMLTKSIESAQRKIEGRNFAIRKNVLEYDDVLSHQREIIYGQRDQVLQGADIKAQILSMINDSVEAVVNRYISAHTPQEKWNIEGLRNYYMGWVLRPEDLSYDEEHPLTMAYDEIVDFIKCKCLDIYEKHEEIIGSDAARSLERAVLLHNVDEQWMDHIDAMEQLKQGIHLRSYGQKDPVVEYRVEGFDMFEAMIETIRENTSKMLLCFRISSDNLHQGVVMFPQ